MLYDDDNDDDVLYDSDVLYDDDDDVLYDDDVACSQRMINDIMELLNTMIWCQSKSDLFLLMILIDDSDDDGDDDDGDYHYYHHYRQHHHHDHTTYYSINKTPSVYFQLK